MQIPEQIYSANLQKVQPDFRRTASHPDGTRIRLAPGILLYVKLRVIRVTWFEHRLFSIIHRLGCVIWVIRVVI